MSEDVMRTELVFIRHGPVAGRYWPWRLDPPLSQSGRAQACAVARRVGPESGSGPAPVCLYTSSLCRARETALIIGRALQLEPRVEPGLREADLWLLAALGLTLSLQRLAPVQALLAHLPVRPTVVLAPISPTLHLFCRRVGNTIDAISARHADQRIAIVAHSGTIRAALAHLLAIPGGDGDEHWGTTIDCCGVTRVALVKGRWQLLAINA